MLLQVPVFEMGVDAKPAEIARQGLAKARAEDYDAVIVDTAGRLQVCASPPLYLQPARARPVSNAEPNMHIIMPIRALICRRAMQCLPA